MEVTRVERGWAGHFILGYRCLFRRNTLLQCGDVSIVVSTVGGLMDKDEKGFTQVGADRNYETMAFHSTEGDTKYHDADVGRQVYFQAPWMIKRLDRDNEANKMHECVVDEITRGLAGGLLYGGCNDE